MQLPVLPKKAVLTLSFGALTADEYNARLGQSDTFAVFLVILLSLNDQYLLTNFYNDCINLFIPYQGIKFNGKTIYEFFGLPNDILNRIQYLLKRRFT